TFIEAEAPPVSCPEHGVVVAQVPWADHGARSARAFDDQVAWLATHLLALNGGTLPHQVGEIRPRTSRPGRLQLVLVRIDIDGPALAGLLHAPLRQRAGGGGGGREHS